MSVSEGYIRKVRDLVVEFLREENIGIVLFGSRARSDHSPGSDVDVGLLPRGPFNEIRVTLLRERLENSTIPYKVEIVNLAETSEEFRREAMKDAIVWKD